MNSKKGKHVDKIFKDGKHILGGEERSDYGAAGIIPYYRADSNYYFLLGKPSKRKIYTYFGGHIEDIDKSNPRATAVREGYEESYDIIKMGKHLPISKSLDDSGVINCKMQDGRFMVIPRYSKSKKYWNNIYFVKIDKALWEIKHTGSSFQFKNGSKTMNNEIEEMRWFSLSEVFVLMKTGRLAGFLSQPITEFVKVIERFIEIK